MHEVTTPGRLLFRASLPQGYDTPENLDSKGLTALLTKVADNDPDKYVDTLQNIGRVSSDAVTYYGGPASIALSDFKLPPELRRMRNEQRQKVKTILSDTTMSDDDKREVVINYIKPKIAEVQKALLKYSPESNSLALQARTGARGSASQLMQLMYGDMLVVGPDGQPIPIAGLLSYGEGVGTKEYWAGSYGSRMGYASVQMATPKGGYFGKLLTNAAQRVVVTENDCGAQTGIMVDTSDKDNIGSVLARNTEGLPAGHILTARDLAALKTDKLMIRSATTCQAEEGICSKCAGVREDGELPPVGSAIGVTAARAVAEPATQLALSSKHSGGVAGEDEKKLGGLDLVTQFVNVPKNFIGGAALAGRDGSISNIVKAPQGGHYVYVSNGDPVYVEQGVGLLVSKGDKVEAGDAVSQGIPNPAEIVKHKGIGEGRRYFTQRYSAMLREVGAGTHRRNVEALARGLINRVKITEPEGYNGRYMGDIAAYDDLVRDYKPRKGFDARSPKASVGNYLEAPALHYTIGTKITPKVAKDLSNAGIQGIITHRDAPPFEPFMPRIMDASGTDEDWKVKLGGFNLKRSFTDAATKGSRSMAGDTSYVPSMIEGSEIYKNYGEAK